MASTSLQQSILGNRWRKFIERPGVPESLLSMLTFIVYARSLSFGFVYDDHIMVANPFHPTWRNVTEVFLRDFSSQEYASNFYRPLSTLWEGLVAALAGSNPILWHISGIMLHGVCVVLVFRLAYRLLDSRLLAMFATAIFSLHPTHVEAVTWISDSADSLMTIFLLLSSLALVRWLSSGTPGWWVVSWLCAAACCFVKEIGVVVPVLLLVLALTFKGKASRPEILLTAFFFVATVFAFLVLRSRVLHGFAHPLSGAGTREMILTEPAALWFYLSHLLLPIRLGPAYPLAFVSDWSSRAFLLPFMFLVAALAGLAWVVRHSADRKMFWFCAVWALAPLVAPLYLKLFPAFELVHDRYLYIPSIALGISLAAAMKKVAGPSAERLSNSWLAAALFLLIAAAVQTFAYEGVWKSDMSLFQRAVELTPENDRAIVNLGVNKLEAGDLQAGCALLRRALEIQPNNAFALFDLGRVAWDSNDPIAAENYIERAVALEANPKWLVLLGNVHFKLGKVHDAEVDAQDAIVRNPTEPGAHLLLGTVLLQQGDPSTAVREFSAELKLYPDNSFALRALQVARNQLAQQQR